MKNRKSVVRLKRDISKHYNSVAGQYVRYFFSHHVDKNWINRFASHLQRGDKVLDAGCGPGNFSKILAEMQFKILGIDISPVMIDAARDLVGGAKFEVMDFGRLRIRASTFDGVFSAYSFLHVPKRHSKLVLNEFRRVLVPGGILCLMVKEGHGERQLPSALVKGTTCFTKLWTLYELSNLLKRRGYKVIETARKKHVSSKEFPYNKLLIIAQSQKRTYRRTFS